MTTELLTPVWYASFLEDGIIEEIAETQDLTAVVAYSVENKLKLKDFAEWQEEFEDCFVGRYNTFRDYADELADELYDTSNYFDYEAFAHDLDYDYWESTDSENYDTLIFRNY